MPGVLNFGAFTKDTFAQLLLALAGSFSSLNATVGTLPVGAITAGNGEVFLTSTNAVPGTQTTRTAAQMYADIAGVLGLNPPNGFNYTLTITNTGAGTFTLAGGTGVTVTGTATVAQNISRQYLVTVNSPTTMTIQEVASGAN